MPVPSVCFPHRPKRFRVCCDQAQIPTRPVHFTLVRPMATLLQAEHCWRWGAVNQPDSFGNAPLHVATAKCTSSSGLDFVSMLLAHGAQTDLKNSEGTLPIQLAKVQLAKESVVWGRGTDSVKRLKKCIRLLDAFVPQPVSKRPRLH